MKTIDEILDEWYPTIPDEHHNGLYARDKVKLIAQEFADQFRIGAVSCMLKCCSCGYEYEKLIIAKDGNMKCKDCDFYYS